MVEELNIFFILVVLHQVLPRHEPGRMVEELNILFILFVLHQVLPRHEPGRMVEEHNILFILVSGVYFTKYCRDMGLQVGLGGWVKNSSSGTVTGKIQGERKKIEQM
uniref:(California timema) hypothetical protein n=1 Tax=Timema californicum TaxID=61474 RepID=A0A7R9PE16_TIMCA|nr:unnamed protein product [Timema californicum]